MTVLSAKKALKKLAVAIAVCIRVLGKISEKLLECGHASTVEYALIDFGRRPKPRLGGIVEHGPFLKQSS